MVIANYFLVDEVFLFYFYLSWVDFKELFDFF